MLCSHALAPGGPRLPRSGGRDILGWVVVATDAVVGEIDGPVKVHVVITGSVHGASPSCS